MERLIVKWYPTYANHAKEQPCSHKWEAITMVDWFKSIGVKAEIVLCTEVEQILYGDENNELDNKQIS